MKHDVTKATNTVMRSDLHRRLSEPQRSTVKILAAGLVATALLVGAVTASASECTIIVSSGWAYEYCW